MHDFVILIVAYRRPQNLRKLMNYALNLGLKPFIYVDYDEFGSPENTEVIDLVKYATQENLIYSKINNLNIGVGRAVPDAINWVMSIEQKVLVLEDDCVPTANAYHYFLNASGYLKDEVKIVSGRAAWSEKSKGKPQGFLTLTNYPLTNGWLVGKDSWKEISYLLDCKLSVINLLRTVHSRPRKLLPVSYFLAACMRNSGSGRRAWDCFIVLAMISNDYLAVNPDYTCVATHGLDSVASTTTPKAGSQSDVIIESSTAPPGRELNPGKVYIQINNNYIKSNIYRIRLRHLLSPAKALFKILLYKAM